MTTPNQKVGCCGRCSYRGGAWASTGKVDCCKTDCPCHKKEEEKSFSDFFHKASPEEKEKVILEVVKEANEEQRMNYERNYSHTHCWKQVDFDMEEHDLDPKATPDCGQPLEKHKQCCLCDTPYPDKKSEEKCEFCKDYPDGDFGICAKCSRKLGKKEHNKYDCDDCQDVMTGYTPTVESEEKECGNCGASIKRPDGKCYNCHPLKCYLEGQPCSKCDPSLTPQESEDWFDILDKDQEFTDYCEKYLPGGMGEMHDDNLQSLVADMIGKYTELSSKSYQCGRAEERAKILKFIDKNYLEYCRQQNGRENCKNCGLDKDDIINLLKE